jgi:RNA polymerase sigma-70 factor (sigma-E family)
VEVDRPGGTSGQVPPAAQPSAGRPVEDGCHPTDDVGRLIAVETVPLTAPLEAVSAHQPFDERLIELYHTYAADLLEMLWVYVGDKSTAEDLVQESFIRVHRAWARLETGTAARAYLRTTAFNLARSGFRRKVVALRHHPSPPAPSGSPEIEVILSEDQQEVATALRALPARQRQCIVLRYWGDLADHEVAAELGISVNSVKTHVRRGMAGMAKHLEKRS